MSHQQNKQKTADNQNCSDCCDAIVGLSNVESSPKIFELSIDCFDEMFEYLSMKDLHSFGQTCKRMNKVAGEYFKQNYSSAEKFCHNDGIYTVYSDKDGVINKRIRTSGFNQFMPCISHYEYDTLRYIQSHASEFKSTNHIYLVQMRIHKNEIQHIKTLLPQLEILQIRNCSVDGKFFELMLKYCIGKLREIYIQNAEISKYNWLLLEYPKLERLELMTGTYNNRIEELSDFFARNPNIQRFSSTANFLRVNGDILLKSKVKLDILELKGAYGWDENWIVAFLNQLYEQSSYKRLYIYIDSLNENFVSLLASLKGLELLCIRWFQKSFNLPQLANLKELIILSGSNATDVEILANGLVKLERLYIDKANIHDIMPFVRRSPKLNKIKFIPHNTVVLNLTMLNDERAKCEGARKITIYTRDDVFLATKWATKNGDINLDLIEMRRSDSYEWNHHY